MRLLTARLRNFLAGPLVFAFAISCSASAAGAEDAKNVNERFKTLPGFRVEQMLGPEAGSIVAMTFDEQGDVIASAEGGPLRLVRFFKLPKNQKGQQTSDRNEKAHRPTVSVFCDQVKNCQGILCYKGYVFAVGDGPSGTAFYRLRDKNNDRVVDRDKDTVETLFKFKGGMGEHGPHQPLVGPDGLIYLMIGNHAWYGGEPAKSSPYHHYYEGDLLRPRYEDANGHAAGIPAPGGTVYRFDIDAKKVELFCGGFRNAYDLAFNRDGELFTYDSDMEWDVGLPWYRATRVNHLVPGGEYGWRSGSAKWPDYFVDSLAATIDIGRGSPTGVMFYTGDAYPKELKDDFLIGDWSRGYIIGVKHRPHGASYIGEQYLLVEGKPLNVSDLEMGPDENVYFCTGGRGTSGGIFRLVYLGGDSVKEQAERAGGASGSYSPDTAWGRAAAGAMKREGGPDFEARCRAIAEHPQAPGRLRASMLDMLERFLTPPTPATLVRLSKDRDPLVVAKTAYLMGIHAHDATNERLVELLDHSDNRVRRIACESLVRAGYRAPVDKLLGLLAEDDRFVAWAARRALEQLPKEQWKSTVLASDEARVFSRGSVALLALDPDRATCDAVLRRACVWNPEELSDDDRLELYRVMQLALVRGAMRPEEVRFLGRGFFAPFPGKDWRVNREVARLGIFLQAPTLAAKLVDLLESQNVPEMEKRHLAFWGRFLEAGWTPELRDKLLSFYAAQQSIEGQGNSFQGYWANVARDVMKNLSAQEKLARLHSGATQPTRALLVVRSLSAPLSADLLTALLKLDEELQTTSDERSKELARETLVALGRCGDERVVEYLHEVFENQPERKQDAALAVAHYALAKARREQDRDLLIRALPIIDGEAARYVLQALTRFESKNFTPQTVRHVIVAGLKLRSRSGQQANELLEHWTGQRLAKPGQSIEQILAAWQAWYSEKYPEQPEAKLPEEDLAANRYSFAQLMEHLARSDTRGDAARGAAVFEKAQCAKCHKYGRRGEGIGPDLTNLTRRFQTKEILESVLHPSQVISDQFAGKTVIASAGLQYTGLVAEQGQYVVVLTTTGEKIHLNKNDIEEIKPSKVSAMPEGLFANLSLEEISDLFAYLQSEPR